MVKGRENVTHSIWDLLKDRHHKQAGSVDVSTADGQTPR